MLTEIEIQKMIEIGRQTRENAFDIRSGHKLGACILSIDGMYFGGCNTEGVISGQGDCAEISAIYNAVIHGKYEFKAITVIDEKQTFPCGSCLQYLSLFYQINGLEIEIVISDLKGNYQLKKLTELLPHEYLTNDNLKVIKSFKNKAS